MKTLRKEIKRQQEDGILQEAHVNVAFWREKKIWKSYSYWLAEVKKNKYAIPYDDLDRLKEIREIDSRAIVLDCGEFMFMDDSNELESYLVIDILRHYNNKESQYNIDHVIKRFEEEQEQPKQKTLIFNKKQFLQSELGFMLNACLIDLWYARKRVLECDIKYQYYMKCLDAYMMAVKTILMLLKQC